MKTRIFLVTALLVGGFVLLTTRGNWSFQQVRDRLPGGGRLWSEPDSVRGAGLTADELNNIDIYKNARQATVYITSTVYQRNWFMEVYPVRDLGSGFLIDRRRAHSHQQSRDLRQQPGGGDAPRPDASAKAEILVRDPPGRPGSHQDRSEEASCRSSISAIRTRFRWARRCSRSEIHSAWS